MPGVTRAHAYPFPSFADAGDLGYSLPLLVGLLLFPWSSERPVVRVRVLLDGLLSGMLDGAAACLDSATKVISSP